MQVLLEGVRAEVGGELVGGLGLLGREARQAAVADDEGRAAVERRELGRRGPDRRERERGEAGEARERDSGRHGRGLRVVAGLL